MRTAALLLIGLFCTMLAQARTHHRHTLRMVATAYSKRGITTSGTLPHTGVAAADPAVLPLGSRILVRGAGPYSGYYVVRDTGEKIQGRKIDLFIPNLRAAKKFGKRIVLVRIIHKAPPAA